MKNIVHNINITKEPKTSLSLDVRTDNEKINIIVNQKRSTTELAKEIRKIFKSTIQTNKSIVLDLSNMEDIGDSLYLTVLNIALVSKNNGIKCKIIIDRDSIGCMGCYTHAERKDFRCGLCFSQLEDAINVS